MKNILLLTDFSDASKNAIHFALQFFKTEACKFHVMYIHKMGSYTSDNLMLSSADDNIYNSLIKEQKTALNELIEGFIKENKNNKHSFEAIVDYDNFIDAINQVVVSKNITLVVIGSNGKTGAQEIIFGSNTINVIRKVICTTFVVPETYTYTANKEILLPLDCKDSLKGNAINDLHKFSKDYNYNLSVLRIIPDSHLSDDELYDQSNLATIPHDYYIIKDVPTHYATHSFAQIKDIGLAVVIAHKERFFERFFKGSSTTKLSNSLRVPILVLHND